MVFFLFAQFSDKSEIFFPKYSQTAILCAAYFRRVVNSEFVEPLSKENKEVVVTGIVRDL